MSKTKLLGVIHVPFLSESQIKMLNSNRQMIMYMIIGALGLFVDLSIFGALNTGLGVHELLANTISIFTSMIVSFSLNSYINFKTKDQLAKRFMMFTMVTIFGYLVSQAILTSVVAVIEPGELSWINNIPLLGTETKEAIAFLGKILSLPFVFLVQYELNKKMTFKKTEDKASAMAAPTSSLKGKSVAVIGGGYSGLAGAYRLQQMGAKVTMYEANDHFGGLASGFKLNDGTPLEKAYHFAYKTDEYTLGLAEQLGVLDKMKFYPTAIAAIFGDKIYPFNTALDLLKFKPLSVPERIRTGLVGVRLMTIKRWQPLTQITAYEWLKKHNGKRATDIIWKPLLQGKFDHYWDKVTMAWLWTRIKVRQDSQDSFGKEELGYFDGSFDTLIQAILSNLKKNKAQLNTNTPIEALGYDQKNEKPTVKVKGKEIKYDAVLSTIPSPAFAKLSAKHPDSNRDYRQKLGSINYLGALLMVLTTKKPITSYYWHQIHNSNPPFLVLLSLDSLVGSENINGNHVYYIGDYLPHENKLFNASEDEIRSKWLKGVESLLPDFDMADVQETHIFKFKDSQHIVGTDYEEKIPAMRTPLRGHYLANFSQIFPEDRGINYALRDGFKVADMIGKDTGSDAK